MRKMFFEMVNEIAAAPTQEDKVNKLQEYNLPMVRQLLMAALDPSVKFNVKIPSYRVNVDGDGYAANTLYVEYRRLYIFLETYKNVSPERKTKLLAQILESIDPSDAEALIEVINKDLLKYGITKDLVNAAFPGLIK
jgi:hypothetical protein